MTQLDFTGPHTVFSRLPGAEIIVASEPGGPIESDGGLIFAGTRRMAEIERCDLLVRPRRPGGDRRHQRRGLHARVPPARGERALPDLGLHGLADPWRGGPALKGKRAACHWAWRDLLPLFGAIPDDARVVRDGDIITGGGVTAGIDFALVVAAEIGGRRSPKPCSSPSNTRPPRRSTPAAPKPPRRKSSRWCARASRRNSQRAARRRSARRRGCEADASRRDAAGRASQGAPFSPGARPPKCAISSSTPTPPPTTRSRS